MAVMGRWVKRVSLVLAGGYAVWNVAFHVLDWLSRFDFVRQQIIEHGWVADVIDAVLQHPPPLELVWTILAVAVVCAVLLWPRRPVIFREIEKTPHELSEAALRARVSQWIPGALKKKKIRADQLLLFGSITHDHYPTSDIDLIVQFSPMSDRKIASAVRMIKGAIAEDFERTFGHRLHVTFFCAHEAASRDSFLKKAGNYVPISGAP
jgi:predicted nucleotidyltransferase